MSIEPMQQACNGERRGGGLTVVRHMTAQELAWFWNILGSLDINEEVKRTDVQTMLLVDSGDVVSGLIRWKGESKKEKITYEREKERGPWFLNDLMIQFNAFLQGWAMVFICLCY